MMCAIQMSTVLFFSASLQAASALAAGTMDPPEVQQALNRLRVVDEALASRELRQGTAALSNLSRDLNSNRTLQSSPRYEQLLQRYQATEARYMRMGGGHALELYGGSQRVPRVSPAGISAAQDALAACRAAEDYTSYGFPSDADKFRSLYKAYEGKIARALQLDRNAFRGGDTLIMLAACEWGAARFQTAMQERLHRAAKSGSYEICWYVERDYKEDKRMGRFMPASTNHTPEFILVPCEQAPIRTTVSGKLLEAMQGWHLRPNDVVVQNGGIRKRPEVDGKLSPIIAVRIYSRNGTPGQTGRTR